MKKLLTTVLLFSTFASQAGVAIVVHPDNDISLSKTEISRIFLGKTKSFSNGQTAIPVNQNEKSDITSGFNKTVLNKSSSQLKAYWSKLVFTGKGTPPKVVGNDEDVMALIANNPNLIGYVDSDKVDGRIKVITTF